jgi:c(7)-type cytochrome triheme protein
MKLAAIFGVLLAAVLWMGSAMAVPPGGSVEFAGGDLGKVTFDGKVHAEKELKCPACHPKVFQMKKGATKFTMADINAGKACGTCHNGEKAFKSSDPANCTKCHKK